MLKAFGSLVMIMIIAVTGARAESNILPDALRELSLKVHGVELKVSVADDGRVMVENYPNIWDATLKLLPAVTTPDFSERNLTAACRQVEEKVAFARSLPPMAKERVLKEIRTNLSLPMRVDIFSGFLESSILRATSEALDQEGLVLSGPLKLLNPLVWSSLKPNLKWERDAFIEALGSTDALVQSLERNVATVSLQTGVGVTEWSSQDLLCDLIRGRATLVFETQSHIPSLLSVRPLVPYRVAVSVARELKQVREAWDKNRMANRMDLNWVNLGRTIERSLLRARSAIQDADLAILVSQLVDERTGELREFKSDWIKLFQVPAATLSLEGHAAAGVVLASGSGGSE